MWAAIDFFCCGWSRLALSRLTAFDELEASISLSLSISLPLPLVCCGLCLLCSGAWHFIAFIFTLGSSAYTWHHCYEWRGFQRLRSEDGPSSKHTRVGHVLRVGPVALTFISPMPHHYLFQLSTITISVGTFLALFFFFPRDAGTCVLPYICVPSHRGARPSTTIDGSSKAVACSHPVWVCVKGAPSPISLTSMCATRMAGSYKGKR